VRVKIPELTLVCVDCTDKVHLAVRAIDASLDQIDPYDVKLLTHEHIPCEGTIQIPRITSLEQYSRFMIRELHKYVETTHALVIQSDGFVLNGKAWHDFYLGSDYGGAPFNPSGTVGNGGFSLRSKRFLEACSKLPEGSDHPEDAAISIRFRNELESQGLKFMTPLMAQTFAFEGRSWNSKEWQGVPNKWDGQFGFHSLLSVLPPDKKPCKVFNHSGDAGDCIYGMATMAALGGGALFLTPDCKYPYPLPPRWSRTGGDASFVDNIRPLLEAQPYVEKCQYTHGTPYSTDFDLNAFREPWRTRSVLDTESIFHLHQRAFGVHLPEDKAWLTVPEPIIIPGRPIVVNRTPRYQNDNFPWYDLVQRYGDKMIFIGTEQEATVFEGFAPPKPPVKWFPTTNMLEAARVVSGARVCIMNQSSCLAIAHGLGKNVIVECWLSNSNTELKRDNAIYVKSGKVEIPDSWLK